MSMTQESFAAIKKRYRRFEILGAACFCATFLMVGIGVLLSIKSPLLMIPAGISWFAMFVALLAAGASFKCPACRSSLHRAKGAHCPGCGSRTLTDGDWLSPRRCSHCDLELRYRRRRQFKVRYCSECGAHLDERGV